MCFCCSLHPDVCCGWPVVIESNQASLLMPQLDIVGFLCVLGSHYCCLITECFIAFLHGISLVWVGVKSAQGLIHWALLRVCLNTAYSQGPVCLIHWATSVGRLSVAVITHLIPGNIRLGVCVAVPLVVCILVVQSNVTAFSIYLFVCLLLRSVRDDFGSVIGKCQGKNLTSCFITHIH